MAVIRELAELARTMRGAVGSLRAAAEALEKFPGLKGAPRARLLAVVAEESERLGELVCGIEEMAQAPAVGGSGDEASPGISVGELMTRLTAAAEGLGFELAGEPDHDAALEGRTLDVPGPQAIAAASAFLAELRREMAVTRLHLGVRLADRHLLLDFAWNPEPADQRLLDWQGEALDGRTAMSPGAAPADRRGLRPLARDHDGEAWFILDRDGSAAHVKVLMPLLAVPAPAAG